MEENSPLKDAFKKFKSMKNISDCTKMVKEKFSSSQVYEIPKNYKSLFNGPLNVQEVEKGSGFFFIPNPFNNGALKELFMESLVSWPGKHNKTNLDIDSNCPEVVWESSLKQKIAGSQFKNLWLYKLRWTSLGHHYDWTNRCYRDGVESPFPPLLCEVMCAIATTLGWPTYQPEAAIVNYYHLNHSMCFHVDDAELNKSAPLISLSMGQPAVYLLGGTTPDDPIQPILLQHGDLVVMSGKSRHAYHSVPRIYSVPTHSLRRSMTGGECWCGARLTSDSNSEEENFCDKTECALLWKYVHHSRININVRQVQPSDSEENG